MVEGYICFYHQGMRIFEIVCMSNIVPHICPVYCFVKSVAWCSSLRQACIGCPAGCIPLVAMLSSTLGMERSGDWLMTSKMCFSVIVIIQQWQVLLWTSAYFVLWMVFLFVLVLDASSRFFFEKMSVSLARGSLVDLLGRLDSLNQFAIISQCWCRPAKLCFFMLWWVALVDTSQI